ncbi:MAG: AAA family ATPase, partial [Bacteroidales bacterium]
LISQEKEDPDVQKIQMHFRYRLEKNTKGRRVLRWSIWGGDNEGQHIPPEMAQEIFFTYLAPLRDAEQELRPYIRGNKFTSLFREMTKYYLQNGNGSTEKELTDEHREELAQKLEEVVNDKEWQGLIKTGENYVNEHLKKADINKKEIQVNLRLQEYKYENIVKGILSQKPVYDENLIQDQPTKQRYFNVNQNGLGENNLIYAAAVLGDIENRRNEGKEHYYALLIEESEAHLHPQKQNTFFSYLNELTGFNVQLFITSHSPTITAKSDLDNLIILQRQNNNISSFSLANSELDNKEKKYLKRFLDVTKSQLFFSNGTVLVEGISEALLLPVFSKILGAEYDLNKNGIEIVNINGIGFKPFSKLYNSKRESKRLPSKCVLITDGDEHRYNGNLSDRASNVKRDKYGNLEVKIAKNTFEYELMIQSQQNADLIKEVYETIHSQTKLKEGDDLEERALELLEKLDSFSDKAILAQELAYKIDKENQPFDVPDYIEEGIKWVINKS